jgi:hypothetical protein
VPFQWNPDSNTNVDSAPIADADGNSDSYGATKSYTDGYSDVYANCYCYRNCNFHCNSYCDCHGDFHSHFHPNYDSATNSDIYTYSYFDDYTQANPYAQGACNAESTTHPAAAPESVITGISREFSNRAEVTDPGYSLSRPSITFSTPLTTSVKRS